MNQAEAIISRIISVARTAGTVQVSGYAPFEFVRTTDKAIVLRRQNGNEARVSIESLSKAIEAARSDPSVYKDGPARLRDFGITHVTSPTWALMRTVPYSLMSSAGASVESAAGASTSRQATRPTEATHAKARGLSGRGSEATEDRDSTDPTVKYSAEFAALKSLFGGKTVDARVDRLSEIHRDTEGIWDGYVKHIPDGMVQYLLIAEAPPWSPSGPPQYVLNPESRERTLMKALRKAFSVDGDASAALRELACNGFLVVDSIPFSMDYSGKRGSLKYIDLVGASAVGYLREKLQHPSLTWSAGLKLAFSLKKNAQAVIEAAEGILTIGGMRVNIDEGQVGVNGAGYPDGSALAALFGL